MEENKRVLLGMSGGTDSSVAAMRLLEAGYEVIGVTFRFYELNGSTEYLEDARNLAERLGIRHLSDSHFSQLKYHPPFLFERTRHSVLPDAHFYKYNQWYRTQPNAKKIPVASDRAHT